MASVTTITERTIWALMTRKTMKKVRCTRRLAYNSVHWFGSTNTPFQIRPPERKRKALMRAIKSAKRESVRSANKRRQYLLKELLTCS